MGHVGVAKTHVCVTANLGIAVSGETCLHFQGRLRRRGAVYVSRNPVTETVTVYERQGVFRYLSTLHSTTLYVNNF